MALLNMFCVSDSKRIADGLGYNKRTVKEYGYRELKIKAKYKKLLCFKTTESLLMDKCVCVSDWNAFEMKLINKKPLFLNMWCLTLQIKTF